MKKQQKVITMIFMLTVAIIISSVCNIVSVITSAKLYKEKCVIIDAGHGGFDPGAVANDVIEKEINLSIALYLKDILSVNGYNVILTRGEDISTKDDDISGVRKSKTSDLKNRLKLINENKDAICISIHQNKFKDSSSCGAQIFYGIKNENSKLLAQSIQTTFTEIQPNNKRQIKPSTSSVYIIHNAQIPTVLVECGFLSNKNDAVMLSDKEYQQKVAFIIFKGIVEFKSQD